MILETAAPRVPAAALERRRLDAGWQLASCAPDAVLDASQADTLEWSAPATLGTVAAMLREAGAWSLDAPAVDFDALDWWYRVRFDLPDEVSPAHARLHFDGLATLAQAWVNGAPVLESDNMHVAHVCDIGRVARARGNLLVLRFRALRRALETRRPRPRWRVPMLEHAQWRYLRTTLLGRTPGWSPPCPPVGPWRDVWVGDARAHGVSIAHVHATLLGDPGDARRSGVLDVACRVSSPQEFEAIVVRLEPIAPVREVAEPTAPVPCLAEPHARAQVLAGPMVPMPDDAEHALAPAPDDALTWRARIVVDRVAPWWPATHGEPARYRVTVSARHRRDGAVVVGERCVGFRTIAVARDAGRFALQVNGVPVFCRGACWTPIDVVSLRTTRDAYRQALAQVRAAGMNMLRIAGPMVYEDDAFLDACDEHGVLLWHDMMFANMDYPEGDAAFDASVADEVAQQLARLQGHPCVAVVCGNSEVAQQAAMWGAPRDAWASARFDEWLPAQVRAWLPGVAYQPSSAHGGAFPHQVNAGTTSYYGVGAYLRPLDDARRSGLSFATECLAFAHVPHDTAISRMPGASSLRVTHAAWKARAPRDLGAGWDFEDVRDHYLAQCYGVDPARLRATDHDRYLRLSRAVTGDVMAAAFAEWRRHGSTCGGALVWWMRDLWAGAGWGLLDDAGRPKACWHALARVLQPRAVLLTDEGNSGFAAHLVNEGDGAIDGTVHLSVWRGANAIERGEASLHVPARATIAIPLVELLDRFVDLNDAFGFGPLAHDAVALEWRDAAGARLGIAHACPRGPVRCAVAEPPLEAHARRVDAQTVAVDVSARGLATGVHFEVPGHVPDDEYFHLLPGESRTVTLRRVDPGVRSWRGVVHALNGDAPVTIAGRA